MEAIIYIAIVLLITIFVMLVLIKQAKSNLKQKECKHNHDFESVENGKTTKFCVDCGKVLKNKKL